MQTQPNPYTVTRDEAIALFGAKGHGAVDGPVDRVTEANVLSKRDPIECLLWMRALQWTAWGVCSPGGAIGTIDQRIALGELIDEQQDYCNEGMDQADDRMGAW